MDKILLSHGSGGELSSKLINDLIYKHLGNDILLKKTDSAIFTAGYENLAFTTDSYVVDPIFFPGGDIGKLAVSGTVNDLAVSGADPLYLSLSLILEEGFSISDLEIIIRSISITAEEAGINIVTGDTKVVPKGKCDKIFINTSGIGKLENKYFGISEGKNIEPGDSILINGYIADHGISILKARENIQMHPEIVSDSAPLNSLISLLKENDIEIKFMRDATRGGLATVLCEMTRKEFGVEIEEENIPIRDSVNGLCEVFGFDPLYLANEGKVVFVVNKEDSEKALSLMQKHKSGINSSQIGTITSAHKGKALLKTIVGGGRIIEMLAGEQLPRIC